MLVQKIWTLTFYEKVTSIGGLSEGNARTNNWTLTFHEKVTSIGGLSEGNARTNNWTLTFRANKIKVTSIGVWYEGNVCE